MPGKDVLEVAKVLGSFVLLAASTLPFVSAIDHVWVEEGLIYTMTAALGVPFDGNLDVPVLVVCGMLAGWLLLFCLDGTKRIQALFVVVGVGFPFGLFVEETGRIAEAIARTPWAAVLGVVIGIASGAATSSRLYGTKRPPELSLLEKLRWLQFPAAGGAFLYGMSAIVVVAVIDYLVNAPGIVNGVIITVAGVVLLASLSVFMRYDQRRDTVVVSPPDVEGTEKYQPYVVGGLYETATDEYHGFPITGDGELVAARTAGDMDVLDVRFESDVSFGYVSSMFGDVSMLPEWVRRNWLLRTVVIESNGRTTSDVGSIDTADSGLPAPLDTGATLARQYAGLAVPRIVRGAAPSVYGSVLDRIEAADTVLLVGPTLSADDDPPGGTETLAALCERYADRPGTDVVVATTRAGPVAESEQLSMSSPVFKETIAVHRIGMDSETYRQCAVVPVDRYHREEPVGFEELLEAITR